MAVQWITEWRRLLVKKPVGCIEHVTKKGLFLSLFRAARAPYNHGSRNSVESFYNLSLLNETDGSASEYGLKYLKGK